MSNAVDDAHDLALVVVVAGAFPDRQVLPDRILAWEISIGQRAIDDDDLWRILPILASELPSALQRDAHRREVTLARRPPIRVDLFDGRGGGVFDDAEVRVVATALQRQLADPAGRLHAWNAAH